MEIARLPIDVQGPLWTGSGCWLLRALAQGVSIMVEKQKLQISRPTGLCAQARDQSQSKSDLP